MAEHKIETLLAERLGVNQEEADKIWNEVERIIPELLNEEEDGRLTLRGFGAFYTQEAGGRLSRAPGQPPRLDENGNPIMTDTYTTVKFKPGKDFLEALNPATDDEDREEENVPEMIGG